MRLDVTGESTGDSKRANAWLNDNGLRPKFVQPTLRHILNNTHPRHPPTTQSDHFNKHGTGSLNNNAEITIFGKLRGPKVGMEVGMEINGKVSIRSDQDKA